MRCQSSGVIAPTHPGRATNLFSYDTFSGDLVHEHMRYYTMTDRISIRTSGMLLLRATVLGLTIAPSFAGDFANQPLFKLLNAKHANDASVAPVQSNPYGLSYSDWSAVWWQWAFSLPSGPGALLFGGADCSTGQFGPVWFLPGAVMNGATPRKEVNHITPARRCSSPSSMPNAPTWKATAQPKGNCAAVPTATAA